MNQWDKASLTPTFLEQLFVTSGVTEYIFDGDSKTNGILLRTEVISSLQSSEHDRTNDASSLEQLHYTCFEQAQCLDLNTQTAEEKDNSSSDVTLCLDKDAMVHSSYSYRKSIESFSGYIFPETTAYLEKTYTDYTSGASTNPLTPFVEEPASINQVCPAQSVLNKQSSTVAFRDAENSTARPLSSCPSDKCQTSTLSPEPNHHFMNVHNAVNSGSNLSSSSSEPLLSETAEIKGRPTNVIEPVKKTQMVTDSQANMSDCENYVESSNCGQTFDDDDNEYMNCTVTQLQPHK